MADLTTYSAETARRIIRDIDELKRRPVRTSTPDQVFPPTLITTRWARTCTHDDYPTYPTSGNVVTIEFGDYTFSPWYPGATATETFTAYDPPSRTFAYVESGSIPAEGTVVRVTWRNGTWSILQQSSRVWGFYSTTTGWRDGDGAVSASPNIGWNGSTTKIVKSFPEAIVTRAMASSGATINSSPAAYADAWATFSTSGYWRVDAHFAWALPSLSLSDAQTAYRVADHSHVESGGVTSTQNATIEAHTLTTRPVGILCRIEPSIQADNVVSTWQQSGYWLSGDTVVYASTSMFLSAAAGSTLDLSFEQTSGATTDRPYLWSVEVMLEKMD
jgi:hypothetical protein